MLFGSRSHVVVVRLCVRLNFRICGSKRDVILTPLLPFPEADVEPGALSVEASFMMNQD